jgi:hypothetical protein
MALLSPIAVLIYIVLGIIGAIIGSRKGRGIPGFFLGLVFGPLDGLSLSSCARATRRPCAVRLSGSGS